MFRELAVGLSLTKGAGGAFGTPGMVLYDTEGDVGLCPFSFVAMRRKL